MKNDDVKIYSIVENRHTGLEFEMHYMPHFCHSSPAAKALHAHEFYQIIWFYRGHGTHSVDFTEYPVSDNTIFFIAPGQVHAFDDNCEYEGVIIHFNASFMTDEDSSESIFLKYEVFNAYDSLPYYKLGHEEALRLQALVGEMAREYSLTGAFAHRDYMRYLVRLFLIRVQRAGERTAQRKLYVTNVANSTTVRFRQVVEENFRTVHTVKEYAQMLNISERTLAKYVRASVHHTPLAIINERIVLEAKRLIVHSTLSIKEISYQLGFEDPSYFVKFFKRMTGSMPGEMRKPLSALT